MTTMMIIGASSGIGEALAWQAAKAGINLVLTARREEKLHASARELQQLGVNVVVNPMDVTHSAQALYDVIKTAADDIGSIDTIVINAGIISARKLGTLDTQSDADIINTNVTGAIAAGDAATKYFSETGGGHIVVTSSVSAFIPLPNSPAYAASKAAVTHYYEGIRGRLKKRGIAVTILHPGFIKTQMTDELAEKLPKPLGSLLIADADKAAKHILHAIKHKKPAAMIPPQPWGLVHGVYGLLPAVVKRRV